MNKSVKVIIGIVIALAILWIIIFAIDYNKCANLKMPIFVKSGETADDGGSGTYYGLGYKETNEPNITKIEELPKDYSLMQAVRDNCVISIHGLKIYNKDELDTFLQNVENNKPDFIRCVSYTIEGDAIITDVNFEGNSIFSICNDLTRDEYSSPADRRYRYGKFTKIIIDETDDGTTIYLKEATEGELQETIIASYDANAEIINNNETKFILKIVQSQEKEVEKITTGKLEEKYDYDIYYYGLESVAIEIDNNEIDLKEALLNNKITMKQIIEQAEEDSRNEIIGSNMYKEGGTMEYYYKEYTIIKSNSLDGNRDVYIGIPEMRLNQVR